MTYSPIWRNDMLGTKIVSTGSAGSGQEWRVRDRWVKLTLIYPFGGTDDKVFHAWNGWFCITLHVLQNAFLGTSS